MSKRGSHEKTSASRVTICDETHLVAGNTGPAAQSEDFADAASHSAENFTRLLAEIREYGEGLILLDQLATAVHPRVIKNTRTKMEFCQVDGEEKERMAPSLLMGLIEQEETTRLRAGNAFFFSDGFHRACRVQAINLFTEHPYVPPPTNQELLSRIERQSWFIDAANQRLIAEMDLLIEKIGQLNEVHRQVTQTVAPLRTRLDSVLKHRAPSEQRQIVGRIRARAKVLLDSFEAKHRMFRRGLYRTFLDEHIPDGIDSEVLNQRLRVIDRIDTDIVPGAERCRRMLDELIACCEKNMEWRL